MEDDYVVNLSEDNNLTCNESIEAPSPWENQALPNPNLAEFDGFALSDLENADFGAPPDFLTVRSKFTFFTFSESFKDWNLAPEFMANFAVGFSGELDELDWVAVIGFFQINAQGVFSYKRRAGRRRRRRRRQKQECV